MFAIFDHYHLNDNSALWNHYTERKEQQTTNVSAVLVYHSDDLNHVDEVVIGPATNLVVA